VTDTPFPFSWMGIKERGVPAEPTADTKITMIDPRDIGAVAAKLLTALGHEGKVYELTATESLTGEQMAMKIGVTLGKPVRFVNLAPEEARAAMLGNGIPNFIAGTILRKLRNGPSRSLVHNRRRCGHPGQPPRTFDAWLGEKARPLAA
jgi:uncharacterized protein YbjT (DUF2867 family)